MTVPGSWQSIAEKYHPWENVIDTVRPDQKHSFIHYKNQFVSDVNRQFRKLPNRFRYPVAKRYESEIKKHGINGAFSMLRDSVEHLPKTGYSLAANDSEIVSFANATAKELKTIAAYMKGQGADAVYRVLKSRLNAIGLKAPNYGEQEKTIEGAIARMTDALWLRAQLRKTQGRAIEQAARDFELVNVKAGIYSSDEAVYRRKGQKRRNRAILEECIAVNELGDEYSLQALSDLSVSNPRIRRGELMTRIRGFEEVAIERGDICEFITITCPSRFHASLKIEVGEKKYIARRNKKFDPELTPREAQKYLSNVWAKIRAKLARLDIKLYGFRVAEPNHCGCPHWHIMSFIPESQKGLVRQVIESYALEDNYHEVAHDKSIRVKFVSIDPKEGTATGYIAKYVSKNIDGHALTEDIGGNDINDAVDRVDAWAACWGIRQFQQIGGPPVSVWRELRRMESEEDGILEEARCAADAGLWSVFVNVMGGPLVARNSLPVRIAYLQSLDERTGELPLNKYGELSPGRVVGLWYDGDITSTRFHEWRIERAGLIEKIQSTVFRLKRATSYGSGQGKNAGGSNGEGVACGYRAETYEGDSVLRETRGMDGFGNFKNEVLNNVNFIKFYRWGLFLSSGGFDPFFLGRFAAPWTCVNNCTEEVYNGGNRKAEKPDRTGKSRADVSKSGFS